MSSVFLKLFTPFAARMGRIFTLDFYLFLWYNKCIKNNGIGYVMHCIYMIFNNFDDKIYIGQTTDIDRRIYQHVLASETKKAHLYNAIRKHGIENFRYKIISPEVCTEDIDTHEQYYIKSFNCISPNGYNLESGGHKNKITSAESKIKMSKSQKGNQNAKGYHNNMKGRKHSDETKQKMSMAKRNRPSYAKINKEECIKFRYFGCSYRDLGILYDVSDVTIKRRLKEWIKHKQ